jgi:hypothetical protein
VGAQAQQALGLAVEGVADEVEVDTVLDDLGLRDLIEDDAWLGGVPAGGEQHAWSEVDASATRRPRTSAQNRATAVASAQSMVIANRELFIMVGVTFHQ